MKILAVAITTFLFAGNICAQDVHTDVPATPTAEAIHPIGIKAHDRATYTLEIAMPVGTVTYGLLTKNNKMLKSGLEAACTRVLTMVMSEAYKRLADRNTTGITYADYAYRFPSYNTAASSRQASMAFATAASLSLRYKKWYVVVPAYAYASSIACTQLYVNKERMGSVISTTVIGTVSGLAAHWLTQKMLPMKEKHCVAGL